MGAGEAHTQGITSGAPLAEIRSGRWMQEGPSGPLSGGWAAAGWGHLGHRLLGGSERKRGGRESEAASRAGEESAHRLQFDLAFL